MNTRDQCEHSSAWRTLHSALARAAYNDSADRSMAKGDSFSFFNPPIPIVPISAPPFKQSAAKPYGVLAVAVCVYLYTVGMSYVCPVICTI